MKRHNLLCVSPEYFGCNGRQNSEDNQGSLHMAIQLNTNLGTNAKGFCKCN